MPLLVFCLAQVGKISTFSTLLFIEKSKICQLQSFLLPKSEKFLPFPLYYLFESQKFATSSLFPFPSQKHLPPLVFPLAKGRENFDFSPSTIYLRVKNSPTPVFSLAQVGKISTISTLVFI
ncbi:MAG: hypothetical protein AAGJ08_28455 [Cyanobacteria bacterium P01_H01_bin.35]